MSSVTVQFPAPHPGQARVLDHPARFKVVRTGRRWAKTTMGEIAVGRAIARKQPIGWFAPSYKYLTTPLDDLRRRLAPITSRYRADERCIEIGSAGVSIDFWSFDNNDDAGRGRKYGLVIVDEAGMIPRLLTVLYGAVMPTLVDYRGSAYVLGTSKPEYPDFNGLWDRANAGEDGWAAFTGPTIENPYIDAAEVAMQRRHMPDWLAAQEFDGVPVEGDTAYFSRRVINQHKATHAREPVSRGSLRLPEGDEYIQLSRRTIASYAPDPDRGAWSLWLDRLPDGRPDQSRPYVIALDLAAGVGASNTVMSAWDAETRRKVAEYADPGITPERAAREAAKAGYWFGGSASSTQRAAIINFESNGPGQVFIRELQRLGYDLVHRDRSSPAVVGGSLEYRYGWHSTHESKELLLGTYRAAMGNGELVNPSAIALDECLTYHVDKAGRVVSTTTQDADGMARAPHGDRVIADALGYAGCLSAREMRGGEFDPPMHSPAWRLKQAKQRAAEQAAF